MSSQHKPCLVYDGDCGFCRRWVLRWKSLTGDRVEYTPSQTAAEEFPQIPPEKFSAAVQLIETSGSVYSGAEAVFRTLAYAPGGGWGLRAYRRLPGFKRASEAAYAFVAARRAFFSRLTTWLWGKRLEPPRHSAVRWIFLRALGLIYLGAFLSLGTQVIGLLGRDGITPAGPYLDTVARHVGPVRFWLLPTLCWLNSSDAFLRFLCLGGALFSAFLAVGVAQRPAAAAAWLFYLSLTSAGQAFLGYQWDNLLLEAGLLAVLLAPGGWAPDPGREGEPSSAMIGLLRWLLFRLMFSSGLVKLLSGDPVWRDLTALNYHYQTQPLPTWIGWYAHQLPAAFQRFSTGMMFVIELAVPFLFFAPRRARIAAGGVVVFFMGLIFLTGNYCFFNLLTIALCLVLLDDAALLPWFPSFLRRDFSRPASRRAPGRVRGVLAAGIFLLGLLQLWSTAARSLPAPLGEFTGIFEPLRSVNRYGLFAVMTTTRGEIVLEGSNDLKEWRPYEFKWKPGDPARRPAFVAPHQPRLDWQMWFAALGPYQQSPWIMNLMGRLLQGQPAVLSLMGENPFPDAPPRYLRALYYEYRFTDPGGRRADGAWWRRRLKGAYLPLVSL